MAKVRTSSFSVTPLANSHAATGNSISAPQQVVNEISES
ncbi:hypothetical protein ACVWW1_007869 [Bradyrhizobium sp. JR3.5]